MLPGVLGCKVNTCPLICSLFFFVQIGNMLCFRGCIVKVWDAHAEIFQKNGEKFTWLVFVAAGSLATIGLRTLDRPFAN